MSQQVEIVMFAMLHMETCTCSVIWSPCSCVVYMYPANAAGNLFLLPIQPRETHALQRWTSSMEDRRLQQSVISSEEEQGMGGVWSAVRVGWGGGPP